MNRGDAAFYFVLGLVGGLAFGAIVAALTRLAQ